MTALALPASTAPPAVSRCERPLVGVAAVLAGAFISTLNGRITTFGLADIRGAIGIGFDEGSWISTVFFVAQMVVTPAAAWMSTVLGTRRVLLWTATIFAVGSLLVPFVRDYGVVIALQAIRGLAVGAFVPAVLGFILRTLPPRWWIWGIAAYAFRFTFSQNVGGAIEGWYSDNGHWEWIFWQNVPLAVAMILLVIWGIPPRAVDRQMLRRTDWNGIVLSGAGFGLIYAGLDVGNRLDWLNSGLVAGLLVAGALLVAAFVVTESLTEYPLIHLRVLIQPHVSVPALLISIYGFGAIATAFVLPDYLTRVQGLRALQINQTLNWIALPQFVLVPMVALLLQRIDARLLLIVGFSLIAIGSWMDAGLTHDWVGDDFLMSQAVEAVGLAVAITALVTFAVANITPPQAAAIAATIQIARLLGNEIGNAFAQTYVRVREQLHSNLLGLHLTAGSPAAELAQTQFASPYVDRTTGFGDPAGQGIGTLARLVQREAYVLAYIDTFWMIAWVLAVSLLLILLLRPPPPNPMTPPRSVP